HFTVGVFAERREGEDEWTALVPGKHGVYLSGDSETRLRERMIDRLRNQLKTALPSAQELFQLPLGTELKRVPIDIKTKGGNLHGQLPMIVEPRWTSDERQQLFVYHPGRRDMWFVTEDRDEIQPLT